MKLFNQLVPFLIFLLCFDAQNMLAQSATAPTKVKKTDNFTLKDKEVSENWAKTDWITLQNGETNSDEKRKTKIKILYSDTGMYFLFNCPDRVLSATIESDFKKLWKEDVVEVFLWPDENSRTYFEYELSPLNHELIILATNMNGDLTRWIPYMYEEDKDRVTRHKTIIQGGEKKSGENIDNWIAKFYIPYKLLRPLNNNVPVPGTQWRANFYRVDYDNEQTNYMWKPIDSSFHEIDKFGTIVFE